MAPADPRTSSTWATATSQVHGSGAAEVAGSSLGDPAVVDGGTVPEETTGGSDPRQPYPSAASAAARAIVAAWGRRVIGPPFPSCLGDTQQDVRHRQGQTWSRTRSKLLDRIIIYEHSLKSFLGEVPHAQVELDLHHCRMRGRR